MQNHTAESIKSLEGYDIAWVEEAQALSIRSLDLPRPTIRKTGRSCGSRGTRPGRTSRSRCRRNSEIPPRSPSWSSFPRKRESPSDPCV